MRGLLFLSLVFLISCSSSKNDQTPKVASKEEFADMLSPTEEEGVFEFNSEDVDELYEEKNAITSTDSIMENEVSQEQNEPEFYYYKIKKGDTALMVAFKEYRNISMWKEILAWNPETKFKTGEMIRLRYVDKSTLPLVNEEGTPYIVKKDDYLTLISSNVYQGKRDYWISIWKNNKVLIQDKDLIYPGFVVYYKEYKVAKKESNDYYRQLAKMEQALKDVKITSRD